MKKQILLLFIFLLLLAACKGSNSEDSGNSIRGQILVDNTTHTFAYNTAISVQEVLRRQNITFNEVDRITPSLYTPIRDGITITIVRVTEVRDCKEEPLEFSTVELPRVDLEPGERRMAEAGQNGIRQVCELIYYENEVEKSRTVVSQTTLQEPQDQVVYVGVSDSLDPVAIEGTIAYLSNGQAWVIQRSNANRRPVIASTLLDGRVFELSNDGKQLLYTQLTQDPEDSTFANELWVVPNLLNSEPIQLPQIDILGASWLPDGRLSYTTAAARGGSLGWNAYNDLWLMDAETRTGTIQDIEPIIEQNVTGLYAYWGTRFKWSPDGTQVAYSKPDGVGLVDFEENSFGAFIMRFPYFNAAIQEEWVWEPELSWSPDGRWVATTVHGPPIGDEAAIDSVVFNVAILEATQEGVVISDFIEQSGIWARPTYSPLLPDGTYQLAYLQARNALNSVGTEYDLIVMDRDGSNARRIFPEGGRSGIRPRGLDGEFVWSPSGRQILIVYQGNLWVVEVATGFAQQLTNDGQAESPRWAN